VEEGRLVPWQGWAQKGRCPKARPSWIQELGQKHPLEHMPVFQSAAALAPAWEVAAVAGMVVAFLVVQSAGKLVVDIEDRVLDGQPDLEHADGQQGRIE